MREELISVVVPVYNVEEYIDRCIRSIINQSYKNLQIILVDDGSEDKSGKICEYYAKCDKRISVIHKQNGGLSDARNIGINIAQGKFITFVDSDDYILENYIERLYSLLYETNADISIIGVETIFRNHVAEKRELKYYPPTVYTKEEAIRETLNVRLRQSAWGKLYKIELFNNIRFPKGKLYEDLAIVFNILCVANKVVFSNEALYMYMIRKNSIMQTSFNLQQYQEAEIIERAMDFLETQYPTLHYEACARRVYSYFVILRRILYSENKEEFKFQRYELKHKIKYYSRGLLRRTNIPKSLKIKIILYIFGENAYFYFQKKADLKREKGLGIKFL